MKKYILILSVFLITTFASFSQQHIFQFQISSKDEIRKLTKMISIDNVKNNIVTAYANEQEFTEFKKLGYSFEILPHPGTGKSLTMATTVAQMANWDRYPTHDVFLQMMNNFATNYPAICRIDTMGYSEDGRPVVIAKITDNPEINEQEPEFYYTGQMHGDEIVAYIMFLRLIDYMLSNYGTDTRVTNLVNNFEIWINPLSNPDGTYAGGNNTISNATRSNSNGIDLNRNFPSPNYPNPSGQNENEIQMQIAFADAHHFVMSANTHSGAELVNFPWDSWTSDERMHADHDWWYHVSRNFADEVHLNAPSSYMDAYDNGVTHGGDWYVVDGSRQDNMCYFKYCREVTFELSNNKMLDCELLPAHWNYTRSAFLGYIEECLYGFNGTVKNTGGNPLNAKIEILTHDMDNSEVYTDPTTGDYYRPIEPGTYSVTFSSEGYISQTIDITVNDWETTTVQNVVLVQADQVTVNGTVIEDGTGNPLGGVKIEFIGTTIPAAYTGADGTYSVADVYEGPYQIKASKNGYTSETQNVTVSTTNFVFDFELAISNAISFESDVPSLFTFSGDADWFRTNTDAYDGDYSMRSGVIGHDGETAILAVLNITTAGNISFYKKVSSESGYDYLRFYIDGVEKDEWSGSVDWSPETFPVTTGNHIFKWEYSKDGSVSSGSDCAWVDYIEFPQYEEPATYTVTFNVSDGSNPIENASINFNAQNINTNISGQAVFTEVSPGSNLPWTVSKTGYVTSAGNLTITNENITQNVIMSLVGYTVTFIISDGTNPIENANVNFNSINVLTDISGEAVFENTVPQTNIPYSISKTGYYTFNGQLSVINQNVEQNIVLTQIISVDVILSLEGIIISPNPAVNEIEIKFYTPEKRIVHLNIYDFEGRLVKELFNNELESGNHVINWNVGNANAEFLSNGIYFCKLNYSGKSEIKKFMISR